MGFFDDLERYDEALSDEQQDSLLRRYYATGDMSARDILIKHNMRLCAMAVLDVVSKN